jgi:hypothetical protein
MQSLDTIYSRETPLDSEGTFASFKLLLATCQRHAKSAGYAYP